MHVRRHWKIFEICAAKNPPPPFLSAQGGTRGLDRAVAAVLGGGARSRTFVSSLEVQRCRFAGRPGAVLGVRLSMSVTVFSTEVDMTLPDL